MENYFDILGVTPESTDKEVKTKYRELIKKYHPDANTGNEEYATEMTAKINAAYAALSTEAGRREYQNILNNKNIVSQKSFYPASFIITDILPNGEILSKQVFFGDNVDALLYEIVTGINLQEFMTTVNSADGRISYTQFEDIYNGEKATTNRNQSLEYIYNPNTVSDENLRRLYFYMRRLLAQSMRFYTPRDNDRILKHTHHCAYLFCDMLQREKNVTILELEGIKKAEFHTYEFSFDDISDFSGIKHFKLKKFLFILAFILILIAVVVILFNVIALIAVAVGVFAIIGFFYRLLKKH
jgi:hypothetical protein